MLGMISTAKHNRIVAEKDAEIAGLMTRLRGQVLQNARLEVRVNDLKATSLPDNAKLVLDNMAEGWGYSAEYISSMTDVSEKQVKAIIRGFAAYGWAERHPFHSEDDNLIRGSGYSLTRAGAKVREAVQRSSKA